MTQTLGALFARLIQQMLACLAIKAT